MINLAATVAAALDPPRILAAQGMTPDPWQREFLFSTARDMLLNCSRGAGKSRVTSALALHTALFRPHSLVLLVSRSFRQASELFRYVKQGYRDTKNDVKEQADMQKHMDAYIRETAGSSPVDELHKLSELKDKGAISDAEFDRAKAKLLA